MQGVLKLKKNNSGAKRLTRSLYFTLWEWRGWRLWRTRRWRNDVRMSRIANFGNVDCIYWLRIRASDGTLWTRLRYKFAFFKIMGTSWPAEISSSFNITLLITLFNFTEAKSREITWSLAVTSGKGAVCSVGFRIGVLPLTVRTETVVILPQTKLRRTPEVSGVPRNFVQGGGGGVSTNSVEDRGQRERGSGGGSP
jgi:hypothetical protein